LICSFAYTLRPCDQAIVEGKYLLEMTPSLSVRLIMIAFDFKLLRVAA
jgi:hypothetical protein